MKKIHYPVLVISCLLASQLIAQDQKVADSLFQIYKNNTLTDTARFQLLLDLSFNEVTDLRQGLHYSEELIRLSRQASNDKYLRAGYFLKGTKERLLGNLNEALSAFLKSAILAKKLNNTTAEADSYSSIADVYSAANNRTTAKQYYRESIRLLRQSKDSVHLASTILNAGDEFRQNKDYDSALLYFNESKIIFDKINYLSGKAYSLGDIGMVYAGIGKYNLAEKNIREAIRLLEEASDYYPICDYLISMSDIYTDKKDLLTALKYALQSLQLASQFKLSEQISNASLKLSELYEKSGDDHQSLSYYKSYILQRDSLRNIESVQKLADLRTNYEVSQKQVEVNLLNQQKTNQRNGLISLGVILGLTVMILFILLRHDRNKQKAYKVLDKQKQETEEQKRKAETALLELQMTQKQLVQSEKMASLGELTAGIAHEIQNPLNFVNNFSELSAELIDELLAQQSKKDEKDEVMEADMIRDIKTNLEKINYHGKRADAIVKNMLQHSRKNTGQKEAFDINALCDEYLRLSYQGLRAKDKSFNAEFKMNFDESIGKINIVPQDIGRVLLNLINNAFYAVNEKKKLSDISYQPIVSVQTKKVNDKVEIIVADNGNGIPSNIIDKIFQPFFTTKPTGEGTGLGLSLSYDIVTKEHNGTIRVESEENLYTRFMITLPA